MRRRRLVDEVSAALGRRQLVYFGTRGDDVESLAQLHQLGAVFCVISSYRRRGSVESLALEDLTGVRVDLDAHDIDEESDLDALARLRRGLLRSLGKPSVLMAYRPSTLVSAACFARRDRVSYLGMFKDHQSAFEHKPWVESSLAGLGIPAIEWHYIADDDQRDALPFLQDGGVMLRRSRGSGGNGLTFIDDPTQLDAAWPRGSESFVSVARFVEGGLPVNIGATVYRDGVTVGLPSVQLIGVPELTGRPFGYCGNDFGAVRDLEPEVIERIEESTRAVGRWLRTQGYLGTFGVDFLVKDGMPLFTEVNPRFQGSTHLSARIAAELGEPCLLLEHLAAHLGLPVPPERRGLLERLSESPNFAHLVVHWNGLPARLDARQLLGRMQGLEGYSHADVVTRSSLTTLTGATVARVSMRRRLTTSGFDLESEVREHVREWHARVPNGVVGSDDVVVERDQGE